MGSNGTTFEFVGGQKRTVAGETLVVPLVAKPQPPLELLARVDTICDDAVSELIAVGAVDEKAGHLAHTTRSGSHRRIVVVSLGTADKVSAKQIRSAAETAAASLISQGIDRIALWIDGLASSGVDHATAEWCGGMVLGGFRFAEYKEPDEKVPSRVRVRVTSSQTGHVDRTRLQIAESATIAEAVNYVRGLAHQPGNVIHPAALAAEARKLARQAHLKCTVLDVAQLKRLGMNGLLAVGQGAKSGPCLIQLEYRGAPRAKINTVLVGKAITFDTGGYSIKPAAGLETLKFDKCGGCTVMGVIKAAAALKLRCNLVGLIPAAENAISDRAYRPGDIIKMMSGKTVEVISTDAEGRLILADALWYAQKHCRPTALLDLATLTGGVNVALGKAAAGLLSNDDNLAGELGEAGRLTDERLWRLPLWDEYRDLIKGVDSDIKNSAGKRDAHAIVGGMFLKEFVEEGMPWAHLDIAAVATRDDNKATGFGVRLLIEYLRQRCS
ncbi:MAG: leucyl aminopeptidase [Planctomycetes bacterium]|nr:leucyl aminopeptidase [Planctomycetota bacterium]